MWNLVYSWYCGWRIWQNWKGLRFESNHIKLVSFSILTFELYDPELDMQTYICFSDLLENDTKAIHSAFKFALGKCALLCVNILWLYGYKIVTNGWLIVLCICILKSESWINIAPSLRLMSLFVSLPGWCTKTWSARSRTSSCGHSSSTCPNLKASPKE